MKSLKWIGYIAAASTVFLLVGSFALSSLFCRDDVTQKGLSPSGQKTYMRNALSVLGCFCVAGALISIRGQTERASTQYPHAVGYYIAVRAEYAGDERINLYGASNLPPGAVLDVDIDDFLGKGSRSFNDVTEVTMGMDGLFYTAILPLGRAPFRRNLICSVVFMPTDPKRPAPVRRIVGPAGEHLGKDPFTNPQLGGNARGKILVALTVVQ